MIDVGGVPYPEALPGLEAAGFMVITTTRLGYTFTIENNRVWPFGGVTTPGEGGYVGTGTGSPSDPTYSSAMNFRKALHHLIPPCFGKRLILNQLTLENRGK